MAQHWPLPETNGMSMAYDEAELVQNDFDTHELGEGPSAAPVTASPLRKPSASPTTLEPTTSPTSYSPTLNPSQGAVHERAFEGSEHIAHDIGSN